MQAVGLAPHRRQWPLIWFASAAANAQRVRLALGVRGDGSKNKKVFGLWSGSAGERRLAQICGHEG